MTWSRDQGRIDDRARQQKPLRSIHEWKARPVRIRAGKRRSPWHGRRLAPVCRGLGLTAVALALTPGSASGASLSFTGAFSRDWNTAANWTDTADPTVHAVPTAGDDVLVPFGAAPQLTAGGDGAGRSIALDPGASLTVSGRDLSVAGGAPSAFDGALALTGATLRLAGEATWAGGDWSLDGATVRNTGDLRITGDVAAARSGDASLVVNTGTLTRDDGDPSAGTAAFTARLVNDGELAVVQGRADLLAGGGPHAGSFAIAADAELAAAGAHALGSGGAVTGDGTLRLDGGTLTVPASAGPFAPGTLLLSGGFLDLRRDSAVGSLRSDGEGGGRRGPATLFAGGPTLLQNVTLDAGATTLSGDATIREISLNAAALNLEASARTLWDSGSWKLLGSTVSNAGDLLVTGDGSVANAGNAPIVRNTGTITRDDADPADGTLSFRSGLKNDGEIAVVAGELELAGIAEPSGGSFTAAPGATLSVASSPVLERGGEISGGGTLRLDAGTLSVPPGTGRFDPANVVLSGGFLKLGRDATVRRLTSDGEGGGRSGIATLDAGGPTVLDHVAFFGGTTDLTGPAVTIRNLTATSSRIALAPGTRTLWDTGSWELSDATVTNAGELLVTGDGTAAGLGDDPLVHNTGSLTRDDSDPSAGVATFGARLRNSGIVHVARGTLDPGALGEQDAGVTTVDAGSTLGGTGAHYAVAGGRVEGAGSIAGALENSGGTVGAGASPGVLAVDGTYAQGPGGTLEAEIAGLEPGAGYDRLAVSGGASLAGTLAIVTPPGFEPPLGSAYDVVTAGTLGGTFTDVTGTDAGDRSYEVEYAADPGRVRLHVPGGTPPPADGVPALPEAAQSGDDVACDPGTWTGDPTAFEFEWLRNGTAIAGATAADYTIVDADVGQVIRCRVVARNDGGAGPAALSNPLVPAARPPAPAPPPGPPSPPAPPPPPAGPVPPAEPEAAGGGDAPAHRPVSAAAFGLPPRARCIGARLRLRLRAPAGADLAVLRLFVDGRRRVSVPGASLPRAVRIRHLPAARTVVSVRAVTLGGVRLAASRTYERCARGGSRPG